MLPSPPQNFQNLRPPLPMSPFLQPWPTLQYPRSQRAGEISGATFCSGTDCPIEVWKTFLDVTEKRWGTNCSFRHAFSCENDKGKQKFLLDMFPDMQHLFADALTVHANNCVDIKTGKSSVAPSATWVAAGFPCDDASGLHPKSGHHEHRTCVAEAETEGGRWPRADRVQGPGGCCFFVLSSLVTCP